MLSALAALTALSLWLWTPDLSREQLEEKYLAAPADMMELGPWRLHVRDSGVPANSRLATPVLMLHGFGASLHSWETWAQGLVPQRRVIRLDLPGSGLSPPDPATDYRDARAIDMILALMDHLGVERVTVVGHSMGGRIAWTFAAQHPQRVHKLVLVAPDGYASPRFGYGKQVEAPAMLGVMRHVLPRPLLHANLEKAYAQADALNESTVSRYHDLIRAPGARQAMLDRLRQTVLIPPESALRQIRAPTLLLWGESDAMIPLANAHDFLQAIPGSRLATLPAVGHLPQEEAPGASLRLVLAFLGDD